MWDLQVGFLKKLFYFDSYITLTNNIDRLFTIGHKHFSTVLYYLKFSNRIKFKITNQSLTGEALPAIVNIFQTN